MFLQPKQLFENKTSTVPTMVAVHQQLAFVVCLIISTVFRTSTDRYDKNPSLSQVFIIKKFSDLSD
jgi:hypothetical protein